MVGFFIYKALRLAMQEKVKSKGNMVRRGNPVRPTAHNDHVPFLFMGVGL
jgi:hypothetical protein